MDTTIKILKNLLDEGFMDEGKECAYYNPSIEAKKEINNRIDRVFNIKK